MEYMTKTEIVRKNDQIYMDWVRSNTTQAEFAQKNNMNIGRLKSIVANRKPRPIIACPKYSDIQKNLYVKRFLEEYDRGEVSSAAEFARNNGISNSAFCKWVSLYKASTEQKPMPDESINQDSANTEPELAPKPAPDAERKPTFKITTPSLMIECFSSLSATDIALLTDTVSKLGLPIKKG